MFLHSLPLLDLAQERVDIVKLLVQSYSTSMGQIFKKEVEWITELWTKHMKTYACSKRALDELWASCNEIEQELNDLDERVRIQRARLTRITDKKRPEFETEIVSTERRIAEHRERLVKRRTRLKELDDKLEASWDIWSE